MPINAMYRSAENERVAMNSEWRESSRIMH